MQRLVTLAKHFEVVGVDIDHTEKPEVNLSKVEPLITEHSIDVFAGGLAAVTIRFGFDLEFLPLRWLPMAADFQSPFVL
jgi:hypothetical protein